MTINNSYGDVLSITYGSSPHHHIWIYTAGRFDNGTSDCDCNCPCAISGGISPTPSFVRTHFYCEAEAIDQFDHSAYYFEDPLWDGSDCYGSINCCANSTQPWFYRDLSGITTSDIEARLCTWHIFAHRSVLIDQLELYIQ